MRILIVTGLFVLWVGLAAATVCPTCNDLNYDCVPANYALDGCNISQSSCPIASCTAHCQGLYGVGASGACSATLFTCICDTGAPNAPVTSGASSTSAPVTKTTIQSSGVSATTVTVTALDFSTVRLTAAGALNSGTGFIVSLVLVGAACFVAILGIAAYVYPQFAKNELGVPFANFPINPTAW